MEEHFLFQAFVYLTAAVISVPIAKRMGLGSVLGYLIAGVVIGPYVLGLVGEEGHDVMHFAEFGVVMMLFLVGLELRPSLLWRMRGPILGLGGLQVTVSTVCIAGIALLFGLDWRMSLVVGMILALSSTAIVLQTFNEKGWMKTDAGQSGFSILLFQDIAVIPMLALLPLLAASSATVVTDHGGGPFADSAGWVQGLMVLGVVAGIVLGGRFLTRPWFRFIADTRLREVFIATALMLVIGIALAMQAVGLSPALGTFLAGVVLAESEYRHELESNIEPFKGLLLGVFFIAVGASINFQLLAEHPGLIALIVVLLLLVKTTVLVVLARVFRKPWNDAWMLALSLSQGGEFGFVLFSFATQNRVLPNSVAEPLVAAVALSMVCAPLLIIVYERFISPLFSGTEEVEEQEAMDQQDNPVIVAGYGRFGQVVARLLTANGFKTTLLDHDVGQIELTRRFGYKVFYGDASRVDLLQAAGAAHARLLVVAIDDREKVVQLVQLARMHFPELKVLARAFDRRHAYDLIKEGADVITRETFGSALMMGESALKLLGFRAYQAHRLSMAFKHHDESSLIDLYEVWGDEQAYGLRVRQRTEDLARVLQSDTGEHDEHVEHAWESAPPVDGEEEPAGG